MLTSQTFREVLSSLLTLRDIHECNRVLCKGFQKAYHSSIFLQDVDYDSIVLNWKRLFIDSSLLLILKKNRGGLCCIFVQGVSFNLANYFLLNIPSPTSSGLLQLGLKRKKMAGYTPDLCTNYIVIIYYLLIIIVIILLYKIQRRCLQELDKTKK